MVLEINLTLQGCRYSRNLQSCNLPLKKSLCYFAESNANALLSETKDACALRGSFQRGTMIFYGKNH